MFCFANLCTHTTAGTIFETLNTFMVSHDTRRPWWEDQQELWKGSQTWPRWFLGSTAASTERPWPRGEGERPQAAAPAHCSARLSRGQVLTRLFEPRDEVRTLNCQIDSSPSIGCVSWRTWPTSIPPRKSLYHVSCPLKDGGHDKEARALGQKSGPETPRVL